MWIHSKIWIGTCMVWGLKGLNQAQNIQDWVFLIDHRVESWHWITSCIDMLTYVEITCKRSADCVPRSNSTSYRCCGATTKLRRFAVRTIGVISFWSALIHENAVGTKRNDDRQNGWDSQNHVQNGGEEDRDSKTHGLAAYGQHPLRKTRQKRTG
jgi:hypothetical protein